MDFLGFLYLTLIGMVLPWAAVRSRRRLDAGAALPARHRLYVLTLVQQLAMMGLALWVAHTNDVELFPSTVVRARDALLALALLVALCAAVAVRWRTMSAADRLRLLPLLPRTTGQKLLFAPLAVVAGIGEEVVYRGTLFELLQRATGHTWIAALFAAASFALGHAIQGRDSVRVIAGVGLAFHGLALATGTLILNMTVHALFDLGVGLLGWRILRDEGAGQIHGAPSGD